MKALIYNTRPDEIAFFESFSKKYLLDITLISEDLTKASAHLAKGYEAVNVTAAVPIDVAILALLKENGIKYIVSRATGINHLDLQGIKALGLKVANVPSYSPNAISEHALMLALGLMRNLKDTVHRCDEKDFTLQGLRGREIRKMTVGIVGTGKIGYEAIKAFKALGATVIAYDMYPSGKVKSYADYVTLDELYQKSDIISYHCPFIPENYHLVNEISIAKMKEGVYLINTSRGELFDYPAVLKGLKDGKIGALGFDVYEGEESFVRYNLKDKVLDDEVFNELMSLSNVIFTPHIGFFTDEAVSNMVEISLENLNEFGATGRCKNEISL
ncbi:NAD(P)-dependent oxidoreductase [Cellulosilyticum sp. I15G10I2]|uniref:NAD(P)-dependent oxidoreductase n=1 Tax=Cellulosilyticum sp. I15G10I2 TaxID=1892843 RepID=UPI00085C2194|nr:NAD(P)-dependent oxidoreductase [Cellulosilyticum sp. I15G10I2]